MEKAFSALIFLLLIVSGCSQQPYVGSWESIKVTQGTVTYENAKGSYLVIDENNKVTFVLDKWIDEMELKEYDNGDMLIYHDNYLDIQMNDQGHIVLDYPMNGEISVIEYAKGNPDDISDQIDQMKKDY